MVASFTPVPFNFIIASERQWTVFDASVASLTHWKYPPSHRYCYFCISLMIFLVLSLWSGCGLIFRVCQWAACRSTGEPSSKTRNLEVHLIEFFVRLLYNENFSATISIQGRLGNASKCHNFKFSRLPIFKFFRPFQVR